MKLDEERLRYSVETLLATIAATLAVYLWFLNLTISQRAFGAIMGSELMIFAMMIYVFYKPSVTGRSNTWLLMGCATTALFLLIAVQLASQ